MSKVFSEESIRYWNKIEVSPDIESPYTNVIKLYCDSNDSDNIEEIKLIEEIDDEDFDDGCIDIEATHKPMIFGEFVVNTYLDNTFNGEFKPSCDYIKDKEIGSKLELIDAINLRLVILIGETHHTLLIYNKKHTLLNDIAKSYRMSSLDIDDLINLYLCRYF